MSGVRITDEPQIRRPKEHDDMTTEPLTLGARGDDVRVRVRETYARAAIAADGCCDSACCGSTAGGDPGSRDAAEGGDDAGRRSGLPAAALAASLGCGNPLSVAHLRPGDRVLDLGSGGGIDVLLSARRVGPHGFAYGVDMTEEMLDLARRNAAAAGATNVEFRHGTIEDLPFPDASVDVVISNCVINLSTDKPRTLAEAFRVLAPGGRLGVADIVADDALSAKDRAERGSWAGCIAGALSFAEYRELLTAAGFVDVSVDSTHRVADGMHSAIVRASKPTG
jgi:SAM-dependent methyltransferase